MHGLSLEYIINSYPNNPESNDYFVNNFVENHFNVNTNIYDVDFILKQICTPFIK